MSKRLRAEIVQAVQGRYQQASRAEKGRIADEFVALAGYHRKYAVRILSGAQRPRSSASGTRARVYDEAVQEALIVVWEAADRICGKRLKAGLPWLVESVERHGHLKLDRGCPSVQTCKRVRAGCALRAWHARASRTP